MNKQEDKLINKSKTIWIRNMLNKEQIELKITVQFKGHNIII